MSAAATSISSTPAALSNGNSSSGGRHGDGGDLSLYFLSRPAKAETDEPEEEPTELNTVNTAGGFLSVSLDKMSVKYTNVNLHGHDVGVVQANWPAPVRRLVYYFEMFVKNAGVKGQVAIGFTGEGFKMRRQPGWEVNSYGYHGDDGYLYRGQGKGEQFGPTFTTNDTVGAGINYASQEFFFTKNGAIVGSVCKDVRGILFPTVAVHSQNEEVEVNFGQRPFAFDLREYETQERMKQQRTIEKESLPPNVSYRLVRSYLLHYGYEETLSAFDVAGKSTIPPIFVAQEDGSAEQDVLYALSHRKTLRQLIRNGEIDTALSKLHDWYPHIVQDEKSGTCFLLHCQKFIELVRVWKLDSETHIQRVLLHVLFGYSTGEVEEAVKYGRLELGKFFELPEFSDLVQDCVALLAYEQPQKSSVGYLLQESRREIVADTVNAMILSTNPNVKDNMSGCLRSSLERLLGQLTVCCLERRSLNGDQGEAFHLHRVLSSSSKRPKC